MYRPEKGLPRRLILFLNLRYYTTPLVFFLESWNRRQRGMSVPAIILQWFINAYADIVILIEDFPINFNRFIQSY